MMLNSYCNVILIFDDCILYNLHQVYYFSLITLGFYCIAEQVTPGDVSTVKSSCPQGYFCPNGTGHNWQACPAGTYGDRLELTAAVDCTACDAGMYCQGICVVLFMNISITNIMSDKYRSYSK